MSGPRHAGAELPRIPGYEVQSLLGRGGMGVVDKARPLRLNRSVALKMLLAGGYAGPTERARFLREVEAVAGLRHAHIVPVDDVGWPTSPWSCSRGRAHGGHRLQERRPCEGQLGSSP